MAALTFTLPSGERQTFALYADRRMRIGRERNNDIVLRDARISRTHAEVSFERGFYVIRDLGSSNGTWVNGREIRTAPLTEGSELRLGSCIGTFTEEVQEESPPPGPGDPHHEFWEPPTEAPVDAEYGPGRTSMAPKYDPKEAEPELPATDRVDDDERARDEDPETRERPKPPELDKSWSVFAELEDAPGRVHDDRDDHLIAAFRSAWSLAALLAPILATVMLFSGLSAALVLLVRAELSAGLAAALLTASFTWAVLTLAPNRLIDVWRDETCSELLFRVEQGSIAPIPALRLEVLDAKRHTIGWLLRPMHWLSRGVSWRIQSGDPGMGLVAELVRDRTSLASTLGRRSPTLTLLARDRKLAVIRPGSPLSVTSSSAIDFDDRLVVALAVTLRVFSR